MIDFTFRIGQVEVEDCFKGFNRDVMMTGTVFFQKLDQILLVLFAGGWPSLKQ